MSLAAVLLILAAIAAAEAVGALLRPDGSMELGVMAAILIIAAVLILLDLSTTAMVAIQPPIG